MTIYEEAEAALDALPIGTWIVAGKDVMQKHGIGDWYREDDNSFHTQEGIADFHGKSGWTVIDTPKSDSEARL